MDQTQLQEQIALYYGKLPSDMQVMFSSMKWMDTLGEISQKYALTEDQKATLGSESTLVLLGIIDPSEYEQILMNEITIPLESKQKMLADINMQILGSLKPQLANTFEKNVFELEAQKTYVVKGKLDERFATLPIEVQNAIAQSDYQKKLYEIGTKNKLQVNKMASLEDITVKLIVAKISPSQYENELALATDLPANTVREIANEVNESILTNIRELMKKAEASKAPAVEDEVPLPPYGAPFAAQTVRGSESKIYADSGIEIMSDVPHAEKPEEKKISVKEDNILEDSNIAIVEETPKEKEEHLLSNKETENSFLHEIEDPEDTATSIIGDKLTGMTKSVSSTTDYSLPKVTGAPAPTKPHDPYHEVIE